MAFSIFLHRVFLNFVADPCHLNISIFKGCKGKHFICCSQFNQLTFDGVEHVYIDSCDFYNNGDAYFLNKKVLCGLVDHSESMF